MPKVCKSYTLLARDPLNKDAISQSLINNGLRLKVHTFSKTKSKWGKTDAKTKT